MPPALLKFQSQIEPLLDKNDPKWRVTCLVFKYAELRKEIRGGHLSYSDLVPRAASLDCEFALLTASMPLRWNYQIMHSEDTSQRTFENQYDTYEGHFVTQARNVLRGLRILLNHTIRTSNKKIVAGSHAKDVSLMSPDSPTHIIDTLAKETCASAPQFTSPIKAKPQQVDDFNIQRLRCYT